MGNPSGDEEGGVRVSIGGALVKRMDFGRGGGSEVGVRAVVFGELAK